MKHIMLDLETLGTKPGSVILSIGAALFNAEEVFDTFEAFIDPVSSEEYGLTTSAGTALWWMEQSEDARRSIVFGVRKHVYEVLDHFSQWVKSCDEDVSIWGNGVAFDNTLLRAAYEKCGMKAPWEFWQDRCYRTVKKMFPEILLKRVGVAHNALDDATSQANHLIQIAKSLPENFLLK
jgi:exodeoxyribonuclease VIII